MVCRNTWIIHKLKKILHYPCNLLVPYSTYLQDLKLYLRFESRIQPSVRNSTLFTGGFIKKARFDKQNGMTKQGHPTRKTFV